MKTVVLQLSALLLALALIYIRKSGAEIWGWRLRLIGGVLPAECLLLSLLIGGMAVKEVTYLVSQVAGWYRGGY
jgi:hypothetical protein